MTLILLRCKKCNETMDSYQFCAKSLCDDCRPPSLIKPFPRFSLSLFLVLLTATIVLHSLHCLRGYSYWYDWYCGFPKASFESQHFIVNGSFTIISHCCLAFLGWKDRVRGIDRVSAAVGFLTWFLILDLMLDSDCYV